MKYFQQLAAGVDVGSLSHAIQLKEHLWNRDRVRTTFENSPHRDVDDILLRFNSTVPENISKIGDDLEAADTPSFAELPQARPMIFDLMRRVEAQRLGRVVITRLSPGKSISPHRDVLGEYSQYYSRYHICIRGQNGSLFRAADETVCMRTGDVWWFDASQIHEVVNNSADERIHMLVDLRVCR